MKSKSTSDSPTALVRHYKDIVAKQSAEIERLTISRNALNAAACNVIDSFYRIGDSADMDFVTALNELEDVSTDDGRIPRHQRRYKPAAPAQPQPTAAETDSEAVNAPPLPSIRKWIDDAYCHYGEELTESAMQSIIDAVDGLYYHVRDMQKGTVQS